MMTTEHETETKDLQLALSDSQVMVSKFMKTRDVELVQYGNLMLNTNVK